MILLTSLKLNKLHAGRNFPELLFQTLYEIMNSYLCWAASMVPPACVSLDGRMPAAWGWGASGPTGPGASGEHALPCSEASIVTMASWPSSTFILYGQTPETAEKDVFLWIYATSEKGGSSIQDVHSQGNQSVQDIGGMCIHHAKHHSALFYSMFLFGVWG